ncbi:hypothetical protein ASE85_17365 [Sphingobium sp. Leaf26]|uniref:hypothetical protein n=1 Tax=Sphingobium sp. Leaf26 TaxID=1735693 RepID=UPI0006F3DC68|nr:hypothetical protein [Sphingobium sp. Leaf26]KQN07996.1 hypothetical protein ASE85_17365 [Sphingobium sp. Leaf26]
MKIIAFTAAIVVATVAVSAAATPAFAQPQGRFGDAKVTYHAKTDRYCFRETRSGSRAPLVQCRTKADWAQNGLTISRVSQVQLAQR